MIFLLYVLEYLFTFRKYDKFYNKILITVTINEAADELTEKLDGQYNYVVDFKTDVPFIIIYYYFLNTEVDVINREYKNRNDDKKSKNGRPEILIEDEVEGNFEKILFFITVNKFIYNIYYQTIATLYGIADRRLKKIEFSFGIWIFRFIEIIDDEYSYFLAKPEQHKIFVDYFN
jgi:hypothetical protein